MDIKKIKEYFDKFKAELNLGKLKSRFTRAELDGMIEKIKKIDIKKINREKIKKNFIWILLGILVVTIVLAKTAGTVKHLIFGPKKAAKQVVEFMETTPVKVYKVKRMDFKDTLPVMGRIEGFKEIDLIFDGKGVIESFNFEEGERILEGDIIANLDQKDALLKLKYASLELEKAKKLFELGGIEKLGLDQKKLEYESAKRDLEKTNIYAPSDGYLGSREKDPGAFVSSPEKIGIFVDLSQVYATFDVIEEDSTKVKVGQTAEVFLDAYPGASYQGTIDMVSPMIEGRTRTQNVKIELENKENEMKPGMFARAVINTYEKKDALIIPASAFKKQEEKYFIFVVHPDEEKKDESVEGVTDEEGANGAESDAEGAKEIKKTEKGAEKTEVTEEEGAFKKELTDEEMLAEDTKAAETAKIKPKDKAKEQAKGKKPGKDKDKPLGPPSEAPVEEKTQTGTVEMREVEIEYLTHDVAEISKGLEEGELIIRELHQEYKNDDKVEITEVQETIF